MISNVGSKVYNVLILGEENSGKTCLVNRIINNTYTSKEQKTNRECLCFLKVYNQIHLKYCSSNGGLEESYKNSLFYKYIDIVILTVSVLINDSVSSLSQWIKHIKSEVGINSKIFICLTMVDINAWSFTLEELDEELLKCKITDLYYVSSKTNKGIKEFENVIVEYLTNHDIETRLSGKYDGRFSLLNNRSSSINTKEDCSC